MRRVSPALRLTGTLLALALVATGCGGTSGKKSEETTALKRGGVLKIASNGDVDYMDPGQIYYTFSQMLFRVMVRTLVSYPALPGASGNKLIADIATTTQNVSSADALTYTFNIKDGVKFQPEAAGGRQVTSADFRYAIERGFYPSVANGYVGLYFKDLFVGDEDFVAHPDMNHHITGIDITDPKKIVFHLKKATGDFLYRLALPLAAPVPQEYAKAFDAKTLSDYGANFASSGPYKIKRDQSGKVVGYAKLKKIELVRNSNWSEATDPIRKAYPDAMTVTEGFEDTGAATEKILKGDFDYNGDFTIPPEKLQTIVGNADQKSRIYFNATNCDRYVALNTTMPPFDKVEVRQAVAYVLDKQAMRQTRGGKLVGDIATHNLIPGVSGFDEVGGKIYDPYPTTNFSGDLAKATDLMRQAGYASGKYTGKPVYLVGGSGGVAPQTTNVVQAGLAKLGIQVRREEYKGNIMYTKYAGVPAQKVQVLTNVGWCWDYPDAYTLIAPLFDGRKITATGNNDYSLINDAQLNGLIDQASAASGTKRAQLWAQADKRTMDVCAVVPWLWDSQPNLISKRVRNYQFTLSSSSMDLAVVALDTTVTTG